MTTKITLRDMRFYAHHGCYATEQRVGTRFTVDLAVDYDSDRAASIDDVRCAVNYLDLYACVKHQMSIPSHILEHVARRTLDALGEQFHEITAAEISISKIAPPLGGDIDRVSVTMQCTY
ncbi:MAG: dihydroneopterin aldolase [Mucinivorans sp.]